MQLMVCQRMCGWWGSVWLLMTRFQHGGYPQLLAGSGFQEGQKKQARRPATGSALSQCPHHTCDWCNQF